MAKRLGYFAGIGILAAMGSTAVGQRTVLPGDLLQFSCENVGDLCVSRIVNYDGKVLLPRIGAVGVATLTPSQIQEKVERLLQDSGDVAAPKVTVESLFLKGEAIGIEGAIAHPIHLHFHRGVLLADLLSSAEPTNIADLFHIVVSHADGSTETVSSKSGVSLIDGDRVVVQRSSESYSVEVIGGVNKPCQLDYREGLTVGEALQAADGLAPRGIGSRITIERMGETIPVSLPDDDGLLLQPKDRLRVEVGPDLAHIVVEGSVAHPGLIDLAPGMTLTQAIAASGGLKSGLRSNDAIWLKRNSVNGFSAPIKLSYRFILAKRIPDPVLSVNDVVHVGSYDLKSKR